ncbi:hypothetical protein [Bacillus thuringiensis]|uniref:hypothetical protein n=1 Tax=Bacillus thuringiensis TaxID=1428 RepID=UPI000D582A88|nr:hypothetical protein [Bacillus thuringiensis]MBD8074968.1 hypothetical protein [Bacillus thuringiensis]
MSSSRLYSELDLLNIIISMCLEQRIPTLDNIFYKEGYKIISIDRSVKTSIGTVKYDVFLSSKTKDISFGFELKGLKASNLDEEQMNKYTSIPTEEFLKLAEPGINNVTSHKLQTIIGINLTNTAKVKVFCEGRNFSFPIMGFGTKHLAVCHKHLIDESLQKQLSNTISIQGYIPTFIHYDKESTIVEIAPRLLTNIFGFAKRDKKVFNVDEIISVTVCSIPNLHKKIGADVKRAVSRKITKLLDQLSKEELNNYLNWDKPNSVWKINKISANSHTNTDQAFLQLGERFIDRLKTNTPFKEKTDVPPGQLSIYDFKEELQIEEIS